MSTASTHFVRSIHNTLATSTMPSTSSHSNVLVDLPFLMNKYPPGLGLGAWRTTSTAKASGSNSAGSSSSSNTLSRRPQRPTLRLPYAGASRRNAPPPPTGSRAQPVPFPSENPFADNFNPIATITTTIEDERVLYDSTRRRYTISIPPAPSQSIPVDVTLLQKQRAVEDREARAKLVAGILLNRVHAVGRPMRRRPARDLTGQGERGYVRSGLSRMVCVGDC